MPHKYVTTPLACYPCRPSGEQHAAYMVKVVRDLVKLCDTAQVNAQTDGWRTTMQQVQVGVLR